MSKPPASPGKAAPGQVQAGWLRTKGRDSVLGGARVQQMKAWNLWWTVLFRGDGSSQGHLYTLRCFGDDTLAVLKARPVPTRR